MAVIKNAFDNTSIYRGVFGPMARFAQLLKGITTPLRLAWSPFHLIHVAHILASDMATLAVADPALAGKVPGAVAQYLATLNPLYKNKYTDLLDVYNGKRAPTFEEAQHIQDLHEMGLWLGAGFEHRSEWEAMAMIARSRAGLVFRVGYDIALLKPVQEHLFGHVIPAAKAMSALERANSVIRQIQRKEGINLRDPEHTLRRQQEFTKIGKQVDARFGEMYYDNLLWKRWAKQIGTGTLLSLGWQLGFLKIYGEGIADLTGNIKPWKTGAPRPGLTNALAYAAIYTGTAMLTNLITQWAMTGTGPKSFTDAIYPRIGKKENGEDERVRPPWFTSEWGAIYHHIISAAQREGETGIDHPFNMLKGTIAGSIEMGANKLNPGISYLVQLYQNKDFYGRRIWDDNSPTMQNLGHLAHWAWSTAGPITVQSALASDPSMSIKAKIAAGLGLGPAPTSANRSPLENEIIAKASVYLPNVPKGFNTVEYYDRRQQFRNALLSGNHDAVTKSIYDFKVAGGTNKGIAEVQKNFRIPSSALLFKMLGSTKEGQDAQMNLMKKMNGEERHLYWRFAAHAVQEKYRNAKR
jgi:hypothetical protein